MFYDFSVDISYFWPILAVSFQFIPFLCFSNTCNAARPQTCRLRQESYIDVICHCGLRVLIRFQVSCKQHNARNHSNSKWHLRSFSTLFKCFFITFLIQVSKVAEGEDCHKDDIECCVVELNKKISSAKGGCRTIRKTERTGRKCQQF